MSDISQACRAVSTRRITNMEGAIFGVGTILRGRPVYWLACRPLSVGWLACWL
jgi:hypothetical protein